jgi:uncharacterized protein
MAKEVPVVLRRAHPRLTGVLTFPSGPVRAGLVPLHPASDPSRDQLLFYHLVRTLPPLGVAVLRYDRRAKRDGHDVPLEHQAADALAAIRALRARTHDPALVVGLWGWSQGAWAAALAAAKSSSVGFLILAASTGVSPAVQMRYGTEEHLRRAGYGRKAREELVELRLALESAIRGTLSVREAQQVIDRYAGRPWFPLAWVPRKLPARMAWRDMDFEPRRVFEKVSVPTLLFYGASDEWSPVEPSIASWKLAARTSGNRQVEILRLRGTTHAPTLRGKMAWGAISPLYTRKIETWLEKVLPR